MMAKKYAFARFFLKRLDIRHTVVETALKDQGNTGSFTGQDMRGKHPPANKTSEARIGSVKQLIEFFPTVESHYTRKDTKRLYLNQNLTIQKMHRLCLDQCETSDLKVVPLNEKVYRNVFCINYNLSLNLRNINASHV